MNVTMLKILWGRLTQSEQADYVAFARRLAAADDPETVRSLLAERGLERFADILIPLLAGDDHAQVQDSD